MDSTDNEETYGLDVAIIPYKIVSFDADPFYCENSALIFILSDVL